MYPSDRVWKGIKRSLHSHKRRYWFGFALLLTGLSYYGIDQLIFSEPVKQITQPVPNATSSEKQEAKIIPFNQVLPGTLNSEKKKTYSAYPDNSENSSGNSIVTIDKPVSNSEPVLMNQPEENTVNNDIHLGTLLAPYFANQQIANNEIPVMDSEESLKTFFITPEVPTIQQEEYQQKDNQKEEDIQKINWLQDYAVYELAVNKPKRINWQLSFAPTMSYRKLTGTKNANIQSNSRNIPIALNIQGDVERLVNHKPALGFELGTYLLYAVSHNFSLKTGLQFNYSRYQIQAYSSATERATIALNSINGLSSSSISSFTQIRNFGGYAVQDLQNQYFQLSLPLGIEVNILGSNKLQLGVAGTVQPTYLLNPNTYLISSDYKNYTKEPSLVRRWNVNTSAETFVSYKAAGLRWQVGPQIRYQLFSSYTNKYPIKEYLIEYGVKIGVTKTIR
jgi:hypothetical protein